METITARGSGYHIKYDNQVEIYVSRIRENPERLKCEVAILLNGSALTRSSPVLTSESGKDSLIRKLRRRRPDDDYGIDWESVIESMAALVIDAHRQGADVLSLSDVESETAPTWAIHPVLPEANPTLLYGDGGSGKSYYATFLSVLIDQGYADTDLRLVVQPGRVLYLDWETDEFEISTRVRGIHAGLKMENKSGILYRRCSQPLISEVDRIIDIVSQRSVDVLICDSLGLATGGHLEEAESTLLFFSALRMIGKTALVISHTNKSGLAFGRVYATNSSRMCWEAEGSPSESGGIDLSLFHKKANNVPTQPDMGWHIEFDDTDGVTFEVQDVIDTPSARKMTVPRLIYEMLRKDGPQTKDALRQLVAGKKDLTVDIIKPSFATALTRLKQAGKILVSDDSVSLAGRDEPKKELSWEV